jgi:hypothetical protein
MRIAHDVGQCPGCQGTGIEDGGTFGAICPTCLGIGRIVCDHCQAILAETIAKITACPNQKEMN